MIVYGIKNCDTVKKARRWLEANGVAFQFHDFRSDGLDQEIIEQWLQFVDWETLLNKRSTTWRQLENSCKNNLNQATAIELMLDNPTLIKRPVLVAPSITLVGFDEAQYKELI